MDGLAAYGSGSEDEGHVETAAAAGVSAPSVTSLKAKLGLNLAPEVATATDLLAGMRHIDPHAKIVSYNPKFDEMFAPAAGPAHPFRTQQQTAVKNTLTGYVEPAEMHDFHFERQRRTFTSYGYAMDPSLDASGVRDTFVGDVTRAQQFGGVTVDETSSSHKKEKRKREADGAVDDLEGFKGPWRPFEDEKKVARPSDEQMEVLATQVKEGAKAKEREKKEDAETSVLHIKDDTDYLGRSFLAVPQDLDVRLDADATPEKCFLPKKCIHTWTGHTKGVSTVKLFPGSGHLLLSAGMDGKIKLWEVYNKRRCVRTYHGHTKAVRDVCFNNDGTRFLSCGYDKYIRLWDTESGECVKRFTNNKVAYCVKFNPDPDKQHMFVVGCQDKKVVQWDINTGEIVQEYDRHLGAVNTITFIDGNRKFLTTSDDKTIRVWEWEIPVDVKYIADPSMHSMPAVGVHPSGKYLALQSLENKIYVLTAGDRVRMNNKKKFTGHLTSGYACEVNFSPDGSYLISGDADGLLRIWDWKSCKLYSTVKAHDGVCIGVLWHPHETSKVITCGWDGLIKLWD
eukprot:Opistho-2@18512